MEASSTSENALNALYTWRYLIGLMRQQTAIVLALLVAAVSVMGAASYNQATVDRDSNIDVSADDTALVGLAVGNGISGDSVKTSTDDELILNLDDEGQGVNGNATFYYGADDSSTTRDRSNTAFNVTNNDDSSRTFDLSYAQGTTTDGTNTVKFEVYTYNSTATTLSQVGTVNEEGSTVSSTLAAGETLYVFVTVDTTAGDLGSGDDLSGTFTVDASEPA
jgi:hypothetical protein